MVFTGTLFLQTKIKDVGQPLSSPQSNRPPWYWRKIILLVRFCGNILNLCFEEFIKKFQLQIQGENQHYSVDSSRTLIGSIIWWKNKTTEVTSLFTTTLLCYISGKIWNFKSVWEKWKLLVSFPTQCFSNSSKPKSCTKYMKHWLYPFSQTFICLCFIIVLTQRRNFLWSLGEK